MNAPSCVRIVAFVLFVGAVSGQIAPVALVRRVPVLNGDVEGSIQQMTAESVTLNGRAVVAGDLFVPGTPDVRLNGRPEFDGTIAGSGAAAPADFKITLNGGVRLGHLRTRTDSVELPPVTPPAVPVGTKNVSVNRPGQSAGEFSTVRNLTLNGNAGQYSIPPGVYGDFTANGNSGFTLGVAGARQPARYAFQHLRLNGNTKLETAGPVIVTTANAVSVNGRLGVESHPEWMRLRIASGGLTLNGKVTFAGYVSAPEGTVAMNGSSRLIGGVIADRLVVNGGAMLQLIDLPPVVELTAPVDGEILAAPAAAITLQAVATDDDGFVAGIEFFADGIKLGETSSAPFQLTWNNVPAGIHALTARAIDNAGASATSPPVRVIVNAPPTVSLDQPAGGAVLAAPADVTLAATATDSDGTIARVEFFAGAAKLGERSVAPYRLTVPALVAGTYTFTVRATDDRGAATDSAPLSIVVATPPVAEIAAPATVSRGDAVTLTALVTDDDGTVVRVDFFRNGVLLGTNSSPTGTPPQYAFLDTSPGAPGLYSYSVRAYNEQGLHGDSAPVSVAVLPTLPYTADFEIAEGYATGELDRQFGWSVPAGAASVEEDMAFSGTRSVLMAAGAPASLITQTFAPYPEHDIVFMDFVARPAAGTSLDGSTIFNVEGARFAFLRNGTAAMLQAFDGDGSGGGQWRATEFIASLNGDDRTNEWIRLTARMDFSRKAWDLYAAGRMVAADLKFRENASTFLSSLAIQGGSAGASRLDFLYAGADNPLFDDANNDGIDDAWETAHGLDLARDNRYLTPAGNDVSVVESYVRGTDPNDYYQGAPPVLTKLGGDNQVAGAGQFNAEPFTVAVFDGAGMAPLANAPVIFTVTQGGGQLATTTAGTPSLASSVAVRTGDDGAAQVFYQQPVAGNVASQVAVTAGTAQTVFDTSSAAAFNDADGNGLPDDWEVARFGHTGADPNADEDGDGLNNREEYQSGSDPTDFYNGVAPVFTSLANSTPLSVRVAGYNGQPAGPILLATDGTAGQSPQQSPAIHAAGFPSIMAAQMTREASSDSISIRLTGPDGAPLVNAPVDFTVMNGDSLIGATDSESGATQVTVRTDAEGIARVYVASLASPAGALVISPPGGANFTAGLGSSSYASVDLGSYTWPVGIATDGTVTFWNDWDLARWRNGVVSTLQVPDSIYSYNHVDGGGFGDLNYVSDPIFNYYPEYNDGVLSRDGTVVSFAGDGDMTTSTRKEEHFIVVWDPDSEIPFTIKGPESTDYAAIYGETYGESTRSEAYLMAIEETGQIWAHDGDNFPRRYTGGVDSVPAFWADEMAPVSGSRFDGVIESYDLFIRDANSSHQAVGSYDDETFETRFFVGSPLNVVDFVPLAINDAGQVLGDDYDPDLFYYAYGDGQVLTNPDAYTSNVIQEAQGYDALNPFVYSVGTRHYLKIPPGAELIRIVGLDEAGNVYGSINPQYGGSFSPGQNVIWIAHPADWGLSAGTPEYAPMLWEQPALPDGGTALFGVLPGVNRMQTTIQDFEDSDDYRTMVLVPAQLAVDANRDGKIKLASEDNSDATTAGRPFRFWANDDDDSGDTGGSDIPGASSPNGQQIAVQGVRDLIDFFPVFLDLKQLEAVLPPSATVKYKLKQADDALRFVYTDLSRADAFKYLKDFDTANYLKAADSYRITSDGCELETAWLGQVKSADKGVILVEGCYATSQPLLLSVEKDGDVIAEVKLHLSINPVERMFRHLNLHDRNLPGLVGAMSGGNALPEAMGDPTGFPDNLNSNDNWLIFVHGFNVSGQASRGWNAEIFKRLYWSGSKARFLGVSWFGNPDDAIFGLPADYHLSVRNAMTTAPVLAQEINALSGSKIVVAHSLGCGVVASAIADHGMNVSKACFVDAALAKECFDGRNSADFTVENNGMTPAAWRSYDKRSYSANWSDRFSSSDGRSRLAWRNRFINAISVIYNFYSSTENVLSDYIGEVPLSVFTIPLATTFGGGTYTWVFQEKAKGFRENYLFGLTHAGSTYMGWGMNIKDPLVSSDPLYWKLVEDMGHLERHMKSPDEIGMVSDAVLERHPVFEPGWGKVGGLQQESPVSNTAAVDGAPSWIVELYGVTSGSALARDPQNRSQLLAEGIPALTWAVGAHALDQIPSGRQYDLATQFADQIHWPRGQKAGANIADWRHSDLREVAYLFEYGLFDRIVTISNE